MPRLGSPVSLRLRNLLLARLALLMLLLLGLAHALLVLSNSVLNDNLLPLSHVLAP